MTTSAESEEVRWVQADDALRMTEHPLIRKQLENMLRQDGAVRVFVHRKDPFRVVEEKTVM